MYTIEKSSDYLKNEKTYKSAIGVERLAKMEAQLAINPMFKPGVIEKIQGEDFLYRYRLGGYRAMYEVYEQTVKIMMLALGPRGSIYRR
jgi:mRNA-degrading endonuclease RelE of RelBE toxin-antitoxin system